MCIFVRKHGSMEKNALKLELIQRIIACNDEVLLRKIEVLLENVKYEVNEPGKDYEVKSSEFIVPDEVYAKLDSDFEAYKKGELKAESWQKVEREFKAKYGF